MGCLPGRSCPAQATELQVQVAQAHGEAEAGDSGARVKPRKLRKSLPKCAAVPLCADCRVC